MTGPVGVRNSVGPRPSGSGSIYDADAQDYFDRAEAFGGTFDQSAINAAYTEVYCKSKLSEYVSTLKFLGIWSKLVEIYLLSGVTWPGVFAKLKYATVSALTNNGFTATDYTAAGSGAGLQGSTSGELLTGLLDSTLIADSKSFGVYATGIGYTNSLLISASSAGSIGPFIARPVGGDVNWGNPGESAFAYFADALPGFFISSRLAPNDSRSFKNGVQITQDTTTPAASNTANQWRLFSRGDNGAFKGDDKIACGFVGNGLSSAQVSLLSTATNELMTAIGANVY